MISTLLPPGEIPEKLVPVCSSLRSQKKYYNYKAMKDTVSPQERIFLVEELLDIHTLLEPTVLRSGLDYRHTDVGLCQRYGIARRSLRNWLEKYNSTENKAFHAFSGRPNVVDAVGAIELVEKVRNQRKMDPVRLSQLHGLLQEQVNATRVRQAKRPLDDDEHFISVNTIKKFKRDYKLKKRKPKDETVIRDIAERSIRSTYKFACLLEAVAGHIPAQLKFNADATQYKCVAVGAGDYALIAGGDDDERDEVVSQTQPTELALFVKHVQMANAAGQTGPLVVVIAVPGMPVGKFFVQKIANFSQEGHIGGHGYLYSCSSRGGNAAMWKHWLLHIVIPNIKEAQQIYGNRGPNGEPHPAFTYTDGEAIILNQAMEEDVLAAFDTNLITDAKGPPMRTKDHQDLDNTTEFRDVKTGMRTVSRRQMDYSNPFLESNFKEYFKVLRAEYPSQNVVSYEMQKKLTVALMQLVFVMQSKYHTPVKIREGFVKTGNHVPTADVHKGESSVDFAVIMSKTKASITREEEEHLYACKPLVVAEFMREGRASDAFLDSIGVAKDFHGKSRDDLVLSRQDAQILTHASTARRFNEAKAKREMEADPVHKAFEKRLTDAARMVKKAAKAATNAEAKTAQKHAKEQEKAAEKARFSALSKADQKAELAEKKEAKRLEKLEKEGLAQRQLEESMELLGPQVVAQIMGGGLPLAPEGAVAAGDAHAVAAVPVDAAIGDSDDEAEAEEEEGDAEEEGEDDEM
jgi:hypothetical protein